MSYGTMPDFSQFKHIDLTDDISNGYKEGSLLASVIGNSFGDQTIYYRQYKKSENRGVTLSGFETIGVSTYHEGNHISFYEMLKEAKRLAK